ncbi:putative membrane protein [Bordetella petrii]|uniref:Membrane protein n=2 Tax=Bordetella petrii TaxID=94624 RepID=A9I7Y2_BORPD|nr:putative membrane protein [Bordetella petrii]
MLLRQPLAASVSGTCDARHLVARPGVAAPLISHGYCMLEFFQMVLHIDQTLGVWVEQYGSWVYLVLFLIIFAETGLVVLPFLPGDSLLFIAGAFGATGSLDPLLLGALLIVAAVVGNTVNYAIGRAIGPRVFTMNVRFLDRAALLRTHMFYERHGGKTIVMSRFLPIFRTFAPFVAGVAEMNLLRFQLFNVSGAVLWVAGLITAGYFFGNIPLVKEHLNTIVLIGLAAAIVPVVLAGLVKLARGRRHAGKDSHP